MATVYRAENTRLSIAEAKRLILDGLPSEKFADVYARVSPDGEVDWDGQIDVVLKSGKPHKSFIDEEFKSLCQSLGVAPVMRWRPSITGYPSDASGDELYSITHEEFVAIAARYGLGVEVGEAVVSLRENVETNKPVTSAAVSTPPEQTKPVQRGAAQDAEVLRAIRSAGYDPTKMPKPVQGRSGVKAEVRKALVGHSPLFPTGGTQFKKAWERLTEFGDISYDK